jgi:hypothetical protein
LTVFLLAVAGAATSTAADLSAPMDARRVGVLDAVAAAPDATGLARRAGAGRVPTGPGPIPATGTAAAPGSAAGAAAAFFGARGRDLLVMLKNNRYGIYSLYLCQM